MRLLVVVAPLSHLEAGDRFARSRWPAHITVLGNFHVADDAVEEVVSAVEAVGISHAAFDAVVEEEALFGAERTVRVDLVSAPSILALHAAMLDVARAIAPTLRLVEPAHALAGFRPHRTITSGPRPGRGAALHVDAVAVVELDPPGAPGIARVLSLARLAPA